MSSGETQPARTVLAWQRTGLGVLAVAGLLLRSAAVHDDVVVLALATVVAAAGLVVLGVLTRRRAGTAQRAASRSEDARAPRLAAGVTGLVVLCAACALVADLVVRAG
jgi:putative membrane protein